MSIRTALLASAAMVATGSALAADLPARVAAPAPYVAAPIFTWTGFYVGLNAGAGWNNNNHGFVTNGFVPVGGTAVIFNNVNGFNGNNDVGFTGGGQVGYNWQFGGGFVVGVEADINYIDRNNNGGNVVVTDNFNHLYSFHRDSSNNWFGTVRGRLGYAWDRFLVYGTGGWAFGGNSGGVNGTVCNTVNGVCTVGTTTALFGSNSNNSNSGWTAGGGVEYAFSNNWSVKLEYLHVDLGNRNNTLFLTSDRTGANFAFHNDNKFDVVRAGVNWRF